MSESSEPLAGRPSGAGGEGRRMPSYLRIAALLRADIAAGRHGPGAKLPSETQLMIRHGVSRSVAKWAVAVLKGDGLVDGRQGSGVFVRGEPFRLVREAQPPTQLGAETGHRSEVVAADAVIARRLEIAVGAQVLRTARRFAGSGGPDQLVTSWRPVGIGPEVSADEVCERVIVRPAIPYEIAALDLPARGSVFLIAQTWTAGGVPVEVADIVLRSDSCELVYRLAVKEPGPRVGAVLGSLGAMDLNDLPRAEFAFPGPLRDQLVAAILSGAKTASTGLMIGYEHDGESLPVVGERSAVVDSDDRRVAVIEMTGVRVVRLAEIDLQHAIDEGEGYESVAQWRAAHERFWHSAQARVWLDDPGFTVDDDTLVVAERFRLVSDVDL
jgi:DNA-binding GntR family transcriptional regulator/uncharacterized protein YhfF